MFVSSVSERSLVITEMEVDVIGPEEGKICGKAVLTGTDTLAGSVANMYV